MIFVTYQVALLDANVLYPAPIRDLLLSLAEAKLFQPKWSDKIHEEWTRNLLEKRPDLRPEQLERTVKAMNEAFPDADVAGYQSIMSTLDLPDTGDHHVVAAAITAGASCIVTCNLKDFPASALDPHGVVALHPDDFILDILHSDPAGAWAAFNSMVARLKNPPLSHEEVIASLHKCELVKSGEWLSAFAARKE